MFTLELRSSLARCKPLFIIIERSPAIRHVPIWVVLPRCFWWWTNTHTKRLKHTRKSRAHIHPKKENGQAHPQQSLSFTKGFLRTCRHPVAFCRKSRAHPLFGLCFCFSRLSGHGKSCSTSLFFSVAVSFFFCGEPSPTKSGQKDPRFCPAWAKPDSKPQPLELHRAVRAHGHGLRQMVGPFLGGLPSAVAPLGQNGRVQAHASGFRAAFEPMDKPKIFFFGPNAGVHRLLKPLVGGENNGRPLFWSWS